MKIEQIKELPEVFYVSVNSSFTTILKLKYNSDIGRSMLHDGDLKFDILNGQYHSTQQVTSRTLDSDKIENLLIFDNLEEAIQELRVELKRVLGFDYNNMATRQIILNEVNKRFGEALNQYYFNGAEY